MKKVLLVADIGGHDKEAYYHVGDEAMFYETYRWYRRYRPEVALTALSWLPTHEELEIAEHPHLLWRKTQSQLYFGQLLLNLFFLRLFSKNIFSPSEAALVSVIRQQDIIHFSGGGNLSSSFRQWLYYCFFIIATARLFGKKVILTSQTIGPLTGLDWWFGVFFLNWVQVIGIRAQTTARNVFSSFGLFRPRILSMLDAAYSLPLQNFSLTTLPPPKNTFRLGLSVHHWAGYEREIMTVVSEAISQLASQNSLELVVIPHHITADSKDDDVSFMRELVERLPQEVIVHEIDYAATLSQLPAPALVYKAMTAAVDLMLTTRYHGLIFALSANVPTVSFLLDPYYEVKNTEALKYAYGDNTDRYTVGVLSSNATAEAVAKISQLLTELPAERDKLKAINKKMLAGDKTLHEIMSTL